MVLCFIALIVFAVLGIFSAKYRKLAKEAFECVFLTVQLKPCQGDLEDRIRRGILKRTYSVSPTLTKLINQYFTLLSWLFVILFFASLILFAQGVYNYAAYGNCNGPQSTGFCIFDPFGSNANQGSCVVENDEGKTLTLPSQLGDHILGEGNVKVTLIEMGCYTCPFTAQAEGALQETMLKYDERLRFIFLPFPIPSHPYSREAAEAAECASEQGKFWEYRGALLSNQQKIRDGGMQALEALGKNTGLDGNQFKSCVGSGKYNQKIEDSFQQGVGIGIYGTPTFFINKRAFVGPITEGQFSKAIDEEFAK